MKLTASSLSQARRCLRAYHYRYGIGLRKITEAGYFAFGRAVHAMLDDKPCPEVGDPFDAATVPALVEGYRKYWPENIRPRSEEPFKYPLTNPKTGRASRSWVIAGKIDGLATDRIIETKTTSEDISDGSKYWLRLRIDPQISMYILGAASLGTDTRTVLYDVIRKPTIRPYNSAKRTEAPDEWGLRLTADIAERPAYYYARREITRLDDEIAEFRREIWQTAQMLSWCATHDCWPRSAGRMTCDYCQFADLCLQGIKASPGNVPSGYQITEPHEELEGE